MSPARFKMVLLAVFVFIFWRGFAQQKPLVVTTTSVFADMAANIGGDAVAVQSIVPIGVNPLVYQLTSNDTKLMAAASLVLYNGLALEDWMNPLIANSDTEAKWVMLAKGINRIENDPHAWMDARRGLTYLENIKNALVNLVPDQKEMFEFNYRLYRQQLQDMDAYIQKQINTIPAEKRLLLTFHAALGYYAERYGLQVKTLDTLHVENFIPESGALFFVETTQTSPFIEQWLKAQKGKISGKLYVNSLSDKDGLASNYLDLLKYDTDSIVKAWTENKAKAQPIKPKAGLLFTTLGVLLLLLLARAVYLVL